MNLKIELMEKDYTEIILLIVLIAVSIACLVIAILILVENNNNNSLLTNKIENKILKLKPYHIAVLAIFKNESHILKEWIQHYLNEGVDKFYLIDNGSTDDFKSQIEPFYKNVELFYRPQPFSQKEIYNEIFQIIKLNCSWLIVCDLDEFIFTPPNKPNLKQFLNDRPQTVGQIKIPWLMFGSNGNISQPESVIHGFTSRQKYDGSIKNECKSIIRCEAVKFLDLHSSILKKGFVSELICDPLTEENIENSLIRLNHYAIQSLEFFEKVKMKRGDATSNTLQNIRNLEYFKNYDHNEIKDLTLSNKYCK